MKYIFLIIIIYIAALPVYPQYKWEKLNGPLGANILSLFTKGDTLIAGTGSDHALIFYSTNRGAEWNKANINVPLAFQSFVFSSDGGIIAAARKNGLFRSYDFINWSNVYKDGNNFWSLGKDSENRIYAGTGNNSVFISDKIIMSTDNGSSWEISLDNYFRNISSFLLFRDSTLFATGWQGILKKETGSGTWININLDTIPSGDYEIFSDTSHNIYAFNVGTRMIMSSDTGKTWKYLDTLGFLMFGNSMGACIFNNRLIGGLKSTGLHYALGAIVSDDGGYTWRESNSGLPPKLSGVISAAKSGSDTYIGTISAGVFKSTDFGDSWMPVNNGIVAANTLDLCFDNEGTLYSADWSNGFQKSTDNGKTWTVINNGLIEVSSMSIMADNYGTLLGGTEEAIYRSTDKGQSWEPAGTAGNNFAFHLEKDKQNRIYALTYGTGLYRSTNSGSSWVKLDNNFVSGYVFGFAVDSSGVIYAGTRQGAIYKSSNDGQNWSRVYLSNNSSSVIAGITVAPNGYIYAANINEGILRSTNNGLNWQILTNGFTSLKLSEIAVNSKGELFAATYSVFQNPNNDKLYKSIDMGESWTDITGELFAKITKYI
jgi:photosystem II stability/assembly factor-like uncharacterized protein